MTKRYLVVETPKDCPFRRVHNISECGTDIESTVYICRCKPHSIYNLLNCTNADVFTDKCPLKSCKP